MLNYNDHEHSWITLSVCDWTMADDGLRGIGVSAQAQCTFHR